jgi:hypothetical protein
MKGEWISVKDELPPLRLTVILWYGNRPKLGYFTAMGRWFDDDRHGLLEASITHWAYLPEDDPMPDDIAKSNRIVPIDEWIPF